MLPEFDALHPPVKSRLLTLSERLHPIGAIAPVAARRCGGWSRGTCECVWDGAGRHPNGPYQRAGWERRSYGLYPFRPIYTAVPGL